MNTQVFGPDRAIVGPRAVRAYATAKETHEDRFGGPWGWELAGYSASKRKVDELAEIAAMYWEYGN